ncbi:MULTISPECIES: hypothetical protein [Isoptericola]|uniref:Uncharacterized protein n=1 Tax=Isoptericola sediminis TaxID=2733572 RepID=A0A849K2P8_9MICO|nr:MULTISPECIES: hypothetical protein [Isoptericola]MDO8147278.1 hypothetical protein [Isoptericola sp. b515]MDO8150409.1 hypothetical protein [Isoptericola sp. b408]NNU27041.1 hypothetical protein [Isoptericola sediminis]
MSAPGPVTRPGSVTFVVVLTWLVAIASVVGGVLMLLATDEVLADAGIGASDAPVYAWVEIALGLVVALVAVGLGNGNRFSRFLVTLLMALRVVLSLWVVIVWGEYAGFWSALLSGLFALLIIVMLWNARANAFFRAT